MSNSFLYPMLPSIITYEGPNGVKLVKWRIQPGHRLSKGTLMFISSHSGREFKYKANAYGTAMELMVKEGDIIHSYDPIIKYLPCSHPTVMKDLCAECGRDLRELDDDDHKTSASVCMIHSVPELRVTQEQAEKLGKADETRLLKDGKLVLLVDLDQTIIHSTHECPPEGLEDVFSYQLYGSQTPWYFTKLRPHTSRFLENISQFYELHICTFGARMYAHKIAELLDPSKKYFSHRILSRDECFDPTSKTGNLKALFPCGDSLVCIIDDRQDVWNFAPNLIAVKPYFFFKNTGDINSPCKPKEESIFHGVQSVNLQSPTTTSSPFSSTSTSHHPSALSSSRSTSKDQESKSQKEEEGSCVKSVIDDELVKPEKSVNEERTDSRREEEKIQGETDNREGEPEIVKKPETLSLSSASSSSSSPSPSPSSAVEEATTTATSSTSAPDEMKPVKAVEIAVGKEASEGEITDKSTSSSSTEAVNSKDEKEPMRALPAETISKSSEEEEKNKSKKIPCSPENPPSEEKPMEGDGEKEKEQEMEPVVTSSETKPTSEPSTSAVGVAGDEAKPIIDDTDDYLLYLEDILKRIHKTYFDCYKDLLKYSGDGEHVELPDLKKIIPEVRRKTLQGVNIVFSGLIPTNMSAEKSKLYSLAKSLGANVTKDIILQGSPLEKTTHVIAAKYGTAKVDTALKYSGKIHLVNPLWIYCCAERWEKVEESLFVLTKTDNFDMIQEKKLKSTHHSFDPSSTHQFGEGSSARENLRTQETEDYPVYDSVTGKKVIASKQKVIKPEPSGSGLSGGSRSSGRSSNRMYKTDLKPANMLEFSPLSGFSANDLQLMDKEVDDACSEGDELSTGNTDSEDEGNSPRASSQGCKRRPEWDNEENGDVGEDDDEDEEGEGASYSEYPKRWKKKSKKCKYAFTRLEDDETRDSFTEDQSDNSTSNEDDDDYNESIGSVDEEMAAAVEREFLS